MKLKTLGARAPIEISLPAGATLTLRPWASGALVAARAAFSEVLAAGGSRADADVAFTAAAAAWGATGWSGVYEDVEADPDAKDPPTPVALEMTPDLVMLLVTTESGVFTEVDARYVIPGLQREAEKNG
jgi:hypothetical protein